MNVITPSENRSVVLSGQPIRHTSGWLNLVRKECLDSREAAIAGVAFFWLVPAMLELVESCLVGRRDMIPMVLPLLIGVGWLYAVIVGAHTVCRDWGKPEENFLLAQPVSPHTIVWAKLITGAALVVAVLGVALVWDMMAIPWLTPSSFGNTEWMMIISVAGVVAAGFVVAFAAAVMTRQMLASTVVAALVLFIWAVAPLLSSHLARFWVPALLGRQSLNAAAPFVLAAFLMVAACVIVSLYYAAGERVFRLGNKQLAWAASLVMLSLFGIAMSEVGNSLHVRDQAVLTEPGLSVWGPTRTIQRGDHFITAYCDYRPPSPRPEMARWSLATFRVSDSGHIQDLRRTPIPGTLPPINLGPQNPGRRGNRLTGLTVDKGGHVVLSGERESIFSAPRYNELETLWRTTLAWPDGGKPEVLSHAELALPPGQRYRITESWYERGDHLPRFTYVSSVIADGVNNREDKLYVFDWSDGPNPGPRYVVPLPQDDAYVSVEGEKLRVSIAQKNPSNKNRLVAYFDADQPETLLDKQNWSFHERPNGNEYQWTQGFERLGGEYIHPGQHGDVAYLSDRLGLRVARQIRPGQWKIVGECRASPLSMLFRLYPRPQILDDSLVIESGVGGIIAYDVSDPSKPKRLGYFNAVGLVLLDTPAFTTGQYLVLREFNVITVLDRPDRRGNGNP